MGIAFPLPDAAILARREALGQIRQFHVLAFERFRQGDEKRAMQ